jgi:hypothetical protein
MKTKPKPKTKTRKKETYFDVDIVLRHHIALVQDEHSAASGVEVSEVLGLALLDREGNAHVGDGGSLR